MKTIKLLIAALLGMSTIYCNAQSKSIQPLKLGDKLPSLSLSPTINYGKSAFNTADYHDQLLIIDFWATWCHYCIAAFPKEDSLSLKFGDKLQFILVDIKADDTNEKVKSFYDQRVKADKSFKLPSVYGDTVLSKLFPHRLMPHYVWVRNGIIIAMTGAEEIIAPNIEAALKGETLNVPVKTL